jgi:membrane-bound lytic murein transglycosylase D
MRVGLPKYPCYFANVKKAWLVVLLLGLLPAPGQDQDTITMDDVLQSAQEWATNNLDEDTLRVLQETDQKKVKDFLALMQKELSGEYVVDLAQLRDAAKVILPILDSHDETQPYALWLKTRLDYLDAAEELRLIIPPPKTEPGQPPPPIPNPQPQQAREIWIKEISQKPSPKETNPLVAELKPIFAEEKIPPQLVWIAEVESSFDARARSPVGAAGLFQLMPATAKRFGLRTWPLDQRLDSKESARAAAKYLNRLHAQFKDWRLALAAYNSGEGTVQKLLDRRKAKTYDAIATHLPAETQMYVPKVEAVLLRREGVKLNELPAL